MVWDSPGGSSEWEVDGNGNLVPKDGEPVNVQSISVSSEAAQFQADGLLVPVAENHGVLESDLVDPANTTNPIQAAIDAVSAESYKGKVLLPYGQFTNDGTVTMADSVSLINRGGHGRSFAEEGTVVEFPSSVTTWIDFGSGGAGAEIDGVNLVGQGQTTSTGVSAVEWGGGSDKGGVHFGRVGFQNFSGRVFNATSGAGAFASQFDYLFVQDVDAGSVGALFDIGGFAFQNQFGLIQAYPKKANSGAQSTTVSSFGALIHSINQGGTVGRMIEDGNGPLPFYLGSFNYEPDEDGQFDLGIVRKNAYVGPGIIRGGNVSGGAGSSSYFFTVRDADRVSVHKPTIDGSTWSFSNNYINVPNNPVGPSWYWGPAGDINDNTGSASTGNLRAMDTSGTDAA